MGGVRHEPTLRFRGVLQSAEHAVDGFDELADLVIAAVGGDASVEIAGLQRLHLLADLGHAFGQARADEPGHDEREHGENDERADGDELHHRDEGVGQGARRLADMRHLDLGDGGLRVGGLDGILLYREHRGADGGGGAADGVRRILQIEVVAGLVLVEVHRDQFAGVLVGAHDDVVLLLPCRL